MVPSIILEKISSKEGIKDGKKFKIGVFFSHQYEILVGVPIIPHIYIEGIEGDSFFASDFTIKGKWTGSSSKKANGHGLQWTPTLDVLGQTLTLHLSTRDIPRNASVIFLLKEVMDSSCMKIYPPLRRREMVRIAEGESNISVMSLNILMPDSLHKKIEKKNIEPERIWACGWNYRHKMILDEIKLLKPSIICFQEVENYYFSRYLGKELQMMEYELRYLYKNDPLFANPLDGCCVAYKSNEYESHRVYDNYPVDFAKKARMESKEFLDIGKKTAYGLCITPNAAQVLYLRSKARKKHILMVNLHLSAFDKGLTARTYQILKLMEHVKDKVLRKDCPFIICGDFNFDPKSEIYQMMNTGEASFPLGVDPSHFEDIAPKRKLSHQLSGLRSAYGLVGSSQEREAQELFQRMDQSISEPEFTFGKKNAMCTLDYIFFSSEKINCIEVLDLWSKEEVVEVGGLPHQNHPSDHESLMANFH